MPVKPPKNIAQSVALARRNRADNKSGFAQHNKNYIFQLMNLNKLRVFLHF
jgi:hypothetical protein